MTRRDHILMRELVVPRPRDETFAFFAAAENLERITPPELRFRIATPLPIAMGAGTRIEYQLGLFGIPFRWRTLISTWEPGRRFVDEQLSGPYAKWVHTHTFADHPDGTLVRDEVHYQLPLWPFGELSLPVVKLQLARIFNYRTRRIAALLAPIGNPRW